jgi:hypothetical protein
LLLAKIRLYKQKNGNKNTLIKKLKDSLESDMQIKNTLEKKINELKGNLLDKKDKQFGNEGAVEENCKIVF